MLTGYVFIGLFHKKDPALAGFFLSIPLLKKGEDGMEFRIYYEDTDAGGVVYHANYLCYFERGRTEYLRARGLSVGDLASRGYLFPVVRLEIDYCSPAVLDDLVRVTTEVLEVGRTSFLLGQQVVRVSDNRVLASGKVTLVCTSAAMKARRLPDELIQAVAKRAEKAGA
jgi:acyl-CoA thioester hydrolase